MKEKTIYWAPFLHFYQPPTQLHGVLRKICDESYRPLINLFKNHPEAKVTVNISAVLTEMLRDHGAFDIVEGLKDLAQRGQVEFVGSSKYHAILPLLPEKEISRQIELNYKTNRFFFKDAYKPQGLFPPEMCYSERLDAPLADGGYKWILLSGVACPLSWPVDTIYQIEDTKLLVFFRDDILSNKISFKSIDSQGFLEHLKVFAQGFSSDKIYVVTAMDAETFGHHIQNWEKLFLEEVYEELENGKEATYKEIKQRVDLSKQHLSLLKAEEYDFKIEAVTISELTKLFPKGKSLRPKSSSWSSSTQDLEKGDFFPLWNHPDNLLHRLQWEHLELCLDLVKTAEKCTLHVKEAKPYSDLARGLLDRALHSCQFWWANPGRMWDINMINKGLLLQEEVLLNAYKAIKLSDCADDLKKDSYHKYLAAREIEDRIKDSLF